ncbi:hypothetical protein OLZ32_27825 [Rhizobium sp. 1AS11]|uniref:hypothetical protein n=1 Tax=Rhizobium acaciae TaxID=2989736 RepID=UPI002223AF2D|nr:hypothetical protein [Rhizobium acaciae]MCW1412162.1 hypothetical protein [Rhizobium acaciae]MCW1744177.1 hypothetical protein [Rhizobium acaciae]
MTTALTTHEPARAMSVFADMQSFEDAQRIAGALVSSDLVPANYRGKDNLGNALIAMDMANRVGVSAIVVMQNLHVIEGRPSWASPFIIGALNSCGLFSPIRFKLEKLGEREVKFDTWEGPKGNRQKVQKKATIKEMTCVASAIEKETGEILEGPEVSISMAVAEGWYFRNGSKWGTMPDLMIRYRAAAFFGRLYAPHILNGMPTVDEVHDVPEMREVNPAPEPAPAAPAEPEKPAGRARGVHAAMARGKAKPKDEPPVIEGEIEPNGGDEGESHANIVDDLQTHGDVFGGPDDGDDDDYNPA